MNPCSRLVALLIVIVALGGCTRLFEWRPVHTGDPDAREDFVVTRDEVEVRVHRFGVWNSWGPQEAAVEIRNLGDRTVRFDATASRLEVEGEWRRPDVADDQATMIIEPDDFGRCEMRFEGRLKLVPEPNVRGTMRVVPDTLRLQLAPLVIGGEERALPLLEYWNPSP
jgi:hypothetical protein